jgi:D-erythro-7,8-dihydroneopterin triphosphate epimerase
MTDLKDITMPELHNFAKSSAKPLSAAINIRNLRLRTLIGFNPDEKTKKQDVVLNIEIHYIIGDTVLQDHVDDALNYKTITKRVISHVEEGQFLLLEKLVADVLGICSDHQSVQAASVTIDKPHALRFADSVSLTLKYRAETADTYNFLEKAS